MEVLEHYSKRGDGGKSAISLIEQADRCRTDHLESQTPSGNQTPDRPRVKVLSSCEIDQLVTAYKAGDSTYVLAQRFSIRRETVAGHLERAGIMRRGNPRVELDTETRRMIIELGMCSTPVSAIASKFGPTDRIVARTLDHAGVARRNAGRPRKGQ